MDAGVKNPAFHREKLVPSRLTRKKHLKMNFGRILLLCTISVHAAPTNREIQNLNTINESFPSVKLVRQAGEIINDSSVSFTSELTDITKAVLKVKSNSTDLRITSGGHDVTVERHVGPNSGWHHFEIDPAFIHQLTVEGSELAHAELLLFSDGNSENSRNSRSLEQQKRKRKRKGSRCQRRRMEVI